jgi:hypothetical protein
MWNQWNGVARSSNAIGIAIEVSVLWIFSWRPSHNNTVLRLRRGRVGFTAQAATQTIALERYWCPIIHITTKQMKSNSLAKFPSPSQSHQAQATFRAEEWVEHLWGGVSEALTSHCSFICPPPYVWSDRLLILVLPKRKISIVVVTNWNERQLTQCMFPLCDHIFRSYRRTYILGRIHALHRTRPIQPSETWGFTHLTPNQKEKN